MTPPRFHMRRLSLPEYAREQGRLGDYRAFVRELREDSAVRLVMLDGGNGWAIPGVEVL